MNVIRMGFMVWVSILLALVSPHWGFAQSPEVASLEGLKAMFVRVAAPQGKLDARRLQTKIEDALKAEGIKILSEGEFHRLSGSPRYPLAVLDVIATVYGITGMNLYVYNIAVQVRQSVWLSRKPVIKVYAPTWERRETGNTPNTDSVSDRLKMMVDQLVRDYRSANP